MRHEAPLVAIRPRTKRLGRTIMHLREATSTMDVARERARAGAQEGLVVVADRQTAGKGGLGRSWSTVGQSLHATLLLRPTLAGAELSIVPLVAATSLVAAVHRLVGKRLAVKWPNDLVHEGRKVGGVLVESSYEAGTPRPELVLVGVGVNANATPDEFPPELRATATSLSAVAVHRVSLARLLRLFLEAFEHRYDRLLRGESAAVWTECRAFLGTIGRRVRISTPEDVLEGEAVDLGPEGELLVRVGRETRVVRAGDCAELRGA